MALGLETGCVVRMCPGSAELAEYVFTLTKAVAEKPLSLQNGSPFSFHPDAALGNRKKVTTGELCVRMMLSLNLPVRLDWLPLPCIALIRPSQLSCLGNSVGRASTS